MPSIELHPTTVYKNGVLVGTGIWSDGSDATSVTIGRPPSQNANGWLPPLVLPSAAEPVQIIFHVRSSATSSDGSGTIDTSPQIAFANPGGGSSSPFSDLITLNTVPADGTISDLQHAVSSADYANLGLSIYQVVERLKGTDPSAPGLRAIRYDMQGPFTFPSGVTRSYTVYETWLEIVYTLPSAPAPLRLYPRSSTRLYPRRRTRRPGTF